MKGYFNFIFTIYILSQFDIGANYELKYFDGEDESSDI